MAITLGGIPSTIVTNNLVLQLDAGNSSSYTSGATWIDISGNANNCAFGATPTFTSASTSSYFTFNGSTHYGTITNSASLQRFNQAQTVMIWMRHTFTSGRKNPWNQAYGGYGTWTHEQGSNFSGYWGTSGADGGRTYASSSSGSTPTGVWNCVCSTRGATGYIWYINGVLSQFNTSTYGFLPTTAANITIGNGYAGFWQGDMAVVLAYTRELTASEVVQNYNYYASRYSVTPVPAITYGDGTVSSTVTKSRGMMISVATYTSSGTYVIPPNCNKVLVQLVGGGGGSAGYCESGGAGGYAEGVFEIPTGTSVTVTVGGGGTAVGYYAAAGNGGTSSFGSYLSATGGYGANQNYSHTGGHSGIGSGGGVNLYQGVGTGHANGGSHSQTALGGGTFFGGAGSKTRGNNSTNFSPAYGTGASGSIGEIGNTGAVGTGGIVIVYAYR